MKFHFGLFPIVVATILASCSSESSTNTDPDSSSSSSEQASSSSSIPAPENTRALKYSDLALQIQLADADSFDAVLIMGKNGAWSKLFMKSGDVLLQQIGTYSLDTTSGNVSFDLVECAGTTNTYEDYCTEDQAPQKMSFRFRNDTLLAGNDFTDLTPATIAVLDVNPVRVQTAAEVVGTYDGRSFDLQLMENGQYVLTTSGTSGTGVEIGIFDVQKDYLFTLTDNCQNKGCNTAQFYSAIKRSDTLFLTQLGSNKVDTLVKNSTDSDAIPLASLVGTWTANYVKEGSSSTTHQLELVVKSNGETALTAYNSTSGAKDYTDSGVISTAGAWITMDWNKGSACTIASGSGFGITEGNTTYCYGIQIGQATLVGKTLTIEDHPLATVWTQKN